MDIGEDMLTTFLDASIKANHTMLVMLRNCDSKMFGNMEILSFHLSFALSIVGNREDGVNIVSIEDKYLKVTLGQKIR